MQGAYQLGRSRRQKAWSFGQEEHTIRSYKYLVEATSKTGQGRKGYSRAEKEMPTEGQTWKGPSLHNTSGKGVAVAPKMAEEFPSWVPGTEQQKVFWGTGKVRVEARCAKGVGPHYQCKAEARTVPASGGPERSGSWAHCQDCKVVE